ncbi:MAG TPA: DUF169 domain-containing protein [Acidimicrobiales bacterium]|nr:DUF169 domain-containing protein [Acidimicrobiales bacterium]
MSTDSWRTLSDRLVGALHLSAAPVFLAFGAERPAGVAEFDAPMSEPAADGRRGRVSASCVFWVEGEKAGGGFSTVAEDHGNCSVGRLTHGFSTLEEVAGNDDVAALLGSGWVTPEMVPAIPLVSERPGAITYGRLEAVPEGVAPDVVMLRVNGRQLMVLSDSVPGLHIDGKPQCHIVAIAKDRGVPAASVGCALSRARTGMRPDEMTCALPAATLADITEQIETTAATDSVVAKYAAEDGRRFG